MSCGLMYHPQGYFPYLPAHQRAHTMTEYTPVSIASEKKPAKAELISTAQSQLTSGSSGKLNSANEEGSERTAQFMSANCVLYTYYNGDLSTAINEHFARALSQQPQYKDSRGKLSVKDGQAPSMSQRNFPPSFWNSNYHSNCTISSGSSISPTSSTASSTDLTYPGTSSDSAYYHHQMAPDPWIGYSSPYDLSYPGSAARFTAAAHSHQYSSFLLQSQARLSCSGKSVPDPWTSARFHHEPLYSGTDLSSNMDAAYSSYHHYPGSEQNRF